ncbi:MAG: hypothetical protein AAFQ07_02820 [Chloroflexota bacterium]
MDVLFSKFEQKRILQSLYMAGIAVIIGVVFSLIGYNLPENTISYVREILPDNVIISRETPRNTPSDERTNPPSSSDADTPTGENSSQRPPRDADNATMPSDTSNDTTPIANETVVSPNYRTGVLVFADVRVSIARSVTVGILCTGLTFLISLLSSMIYYRKLSFDRYDLADIERYAIKHHRSWSARIIIGATSGVILSVLCWFFWTLFGMMFSSLWLSKIGATFVTALYCGVIGFAVTYWNIALRTMNVVSLGLLTFALGLFGSFLLSNDPQWWQISLSYLGYDSGADIVFRISMVAVGLMLLTVIRDLLDTLWIEVLMGHLSKIRYRILAVGAVLICLGIMGVGIFPVRVSELSTHLHNLSVYAAGGLFSLGMFGIGFIAPGLFHPFFIRVSWGLLAFCMGLVGIYIAGIINFVALEILAFAIFSIWLYLLHEFTLHHLSSLNRNKLKRTTQMMIAIVDD